MKPLLSDVVGVGGGERVGRQVVLSEVCCNVIVTVAWDADVRGTGQIPPDTRRRS